MSATRLNDPLMAYPVGSIYMSVNSTDPGTLFGGTWERITGKFLLAATDGGAAGGNSNASIAAGNTGGEAVHTLTGNESGVRAHSHKSSAGNGEGRFLCQPGITGIGTVRVAAASSGNNYVPKSSSNIDFSGQSYTAGATASNAYSAHNNMPPYLAVYVWKRTA